MFYTKAPYNSGHGHFGNDYIQSFPDLHAPSTFEERAKYTREKLRYQLLKTKPEDAKNRNRCLIQISTCETALSYKHEKMFSSASRIKCPVSPSLRLLPSWAIAKSDRSTNKILTHHLIISKKNQLSLSGFFPLFGSPPLLAFSINLCRNENNCS